ncbi:tRNA 5-methoxyuridine(34)/uridine 5-oxyacetic acid(34) synthase CmoB [Moraxella oblonga]|uniref:tRNA 5-methoxyuridine(34)/uridine 5-oxyacetic acid(34) synthase CmoB n=1 Tax=Moraxella oblonga TaxID=200413 RepID=UPI0008364143|nr:tRNA 5-methoxyuridine(34)/uridine 5-oxyacetic acid(34) synthase CmoB [Moraxella oblonga]
MNSIFQAEQALYLEFLTLSQKYPIVNDWLKQLPEWIAHIKNKERYANATYFESAVDKLPLFNVNGIDLTQNNISAHIDFDINKLKKSEALLKTLMPWRKGGFYFGNDTHHIHIDTEWRSDFKWNRVLPYISPLKDKRVLDVGGGSGYHGFRMLGEGAKTVIVIDPSCLFYYQFMAIKKLLGGHNPNPILNHIHFMPVGLEQLPKSELFHSVFCMGVLYHRKSPFECLEQLKNQLVKGGELILETLIVDGDETTVLVPKERYAMMNNVYCLPSVPALTLWLQKVGFKEIKCVDVNITTSDEQRATAWMDYHSLADFLNPNDNSKTIEGYPRPKRAVMIAKR